MASPSNILTHHGGYMRVIPSWNLPPSGWRRYMHSSKSPSPVAYAREISPGSEVLPHDKDDEDSIDDSDGDIFSSTFVPASSTPDLSYAASSSPGAFSSRQEHQFQEDDAESMAPDVEDSTSPPLDGGDAHFSRRLHSLLEVAAQEQRQHKDNGMDDNLTLCSPRQDTRPQQIFLRAISASEMANTSSLSHYNPLRQPQDQVLSAATTTKHVLSGAPLTVKDSSIALSRTSTVGAATSSACMLSYTGKRYPKKRIHSFRDSRSVSYSSFDISSDDDGASSLVSSPWSQNVLSRTESLSSPHPSKRLKLSERAGTPRYAREPAALRKARSLRSDASFEYNKENAADPPLVPTVPNSRASSPVPTRKSTRPLPSILHYFPAEQIPRVPHNADDAAERRLCLLLEKEGRDRKRSGFVTSALFARDVVMDCVYVSSHAMVEDDYASGQDVDEDDDDDEDEQADDQDFGTAIGDELRANAIEWILTVIPPTDDESDSPRQRKPRIYSDDLHDQLVENPDTRFFAAYLFARYFWTVSTPDAPSTACDSVSAIQGRQEQLAEGERRLVWDFAVAAVALSVKFHRDCLPPLTPVYARDFMAIAPHEMCFEDFELAQRDILDSCAYELATPTPQEFLDELHATLATLRALVGPGRTWACVIGATWEKLLRAVREPDVFRFPVSLLTAAALHEAIADVILKSLADEEARAACVCGCHDSERCDEKSGREETMEATRSVLEDIRDVLGFSEVAMDVCKAWLVPLRNPGSHSGSMRSKYFKEAEEDDDEMEMY